MIYTYIWLPAAARSVSFFFLYAVLSLLFSRSCPSSEFPGLYIRPVQSAQFLQPRSTIPGTTQSSCIHRRAIRTPRSSCPPAEASSPRYARHGRRLDLEVPGSRYAGMDVCLRLGLLNVARDSPSAGYLY
ncbi:hypothetical protein FB451DRAFT_1265429 [Mycena latifolia]|nr:hypothetical protein FB451DRAFT_1265429 [Mycena latifolia]